MLRARTVASFTGHTRNRMLGINTTVDDSGGCMTVEATPHFAGGQGAPNRLVQ